MINPTGPTEPLYAAIVTSIDNNRATITFEAAGRQHVFPLPTHNWCELGAVGRLDPRDGRNFAFHVYPDSRLRRSPNNDNAAAGVWAWTIDEGDGIPFAKAKRIPGKHDRVLHDNTRPITLDVPLKFIEYCASHNRTAETVLRGFIADLCELQNYVTLPREDGYSSNRSDARMFAQQWFECAYFGRTYQ